MYYVLNNNGVFIMAKESVADIPSLEDFPLWMQDNLNIVIDSTHSEHYNIATTQMKEQLRKSCFWDLLCRKINECKDEYFGEYATKLLKETKEPIVEIEVKPALSFIGKVYRENFIDNARFPKAPKGGWITPDNWFSRINDILRTTIIVRYLDGIEYIATRLEKLCSNQSRLIDECRYLAKIEGYYAAHLYFNMEFEIPGMGWETQKVVSPVEIQLTTQVKEVIKDLIHPYYEEERIKRYSEEDPWQWRYDSPEFARNYLGHIIHYVEGMMVGIRRRNK